MYQTAAPPPLAASVRTPADDLILLEVGGITAIFPASGRGVRDMNLTITHGSFTVITGQIGAGKTTFMRALLGLLPHDAGEIRWNGQPVADPATWFQPPRCAYTPQAPRLFSTTLRENILLGLPPGEFDLAAALHAAVLEPDVATLESGLDTVVGQRGVRLSGGQVQRSGARACWCVRRLYWCATISRRRWMWRQSGCSGRGLPGCARMGAGMRRCSSSPIAGPCCAWRIRSSCSKTVRWTPSVNLMRCWNRLRRCSGCGRARKG